MNKYIAKYYRLSLDDDNAGESDSITNQRDMVDRFISTVEGLSSMPAKEFADDGYTGTNFNRPGVSKLLEAVRRGEISCIVVKDLSRFGRQYLEVSKYIEQIFPYLGVRFIAVNDHYDSDNHKGMTADIDIPIKNLLNALYSSDVSEKVKTAKAAMARQAIYYHPFAPYGYKKDPKDIHRLAIDDPAAEIVMRIFVLSCEGKSPFQIASLLNAERIPTPAAYKKLNGSSLKARGIATPLWTNSTVNRILRDEQYLGTYVCGKIEVKDLGTNKYTRKPKEEWVRIPNTHPPIISLEQWNTAIAKRSKISGQRGKPNTSRILYNRVRCGRCSHVLRYCTERGKSYYFCDTLKYTEEYGCKRGRFQAEHIVSAVTATVQFQLSVMLDMARRAAADNGTCKRGTEITAARLSEIKQLQAFKRQLYGRYKTGTLDKAAFIKEREAIETDIEKKVSECDSLLAGNDELKTAQQVFDSFTGLQAADDLSADIVNTLVEAVYVYDADRIEVRFSFGDEPEQIIRGLERMAHTTK